VAVLVEIWSDVVCPWCYVGKRNLETALRRFCHPEQVDVAWKSFELDPTSPSKVDMTMSQILRRKYGLTEEQADSANRRMTGLAARVGLDYHLDDIQVGNTFDAHRLVHLAAETGRADAMKERLFSAYFTEGKSVSDHDSLRALAEEIGLDRAEVADMLSRDTFAADVRQDEAGATALGVTGVPFFVIDGHYGIAGAQPPEVILAGLEQAWSDRHPTISVPVDAADACYDGACAVPEAKVDQAPDTP
jgi:predicted DsbA family dithiol-disulfide isomerase